MALALFASVAAVVVGTLQALKMWLAAKPKPVEPSALEGRLADLEAWKSRTEMGKLR